MQIPHLYDIQYTQLSPTTWCATAHVSMPISLHLWDKVSVSLTANILCTYPINFSNRKWQYNTHKSCTSVQKNAQRQRRQQRVGVRQLLQELLATLEINDTLDESQFPYRLNNSKYYVCFSHTSAGDVNNDNPNTMVAVVISHQRTVGIDIETNKVAWHVAQRFYHPDEIILLQALPIDQRDTVVRLLWQVKESFIKINHHTLAQGLGMNYQHLISDIAINLEQDKTLVTLTDNQPLPYQIVVLSSYQTVVVF
ncbi:4'-phosphopantetheinyl transferase family protein [Psychrobacter sp. ENNN9_III]|uniref:4'-phosphopantetheinyl transferase family protein n=1 Tax=Psychrobacter sp. ENNN9_III TaxID=1254334 RepID=UPI00071E8248|nr:4'-phosphopantetheinyl transferase superfamily protein [Psychrobacter sp. ENNN9_III]